MQLCTPMQQSRCLRNAGGMCLRLDACNSSDLLREVFGFTLYALPRRHADEVSHRQAAPQAPLGGTQQLLDAG